MIIHSKRCIFIHIPKVAGQSIEAALQRDASPGDGSRAEMGLRKRKDGEAGPPRLAHLTAVEYAKLGFVSAEQYKTYFKFAFVRDPWNRSYSIYRHFGFQAYMGFEYFLEYVLKRDLWRKQYWFVRPQCDFVFDKSGECCVDFVGRFETIETNFRHVAQVLNLTSDVLPHVNRGGRPGPFAVLRAVRRYPGVLRHVLSFGRSDSKSHADAKSFESLGIVRELYGCDIERFGYGADYELSTA
jgi:Sulfotransferase family